MQQIGEVSDAQLVTSIARYSEIALAEVGSLNRIVRSDESATIERTTADIVAEAGTRKLELRATGQVVTFDGFLKLYQEGRDEEPEDEPELEPDEDPEDDPDGEPELEPLLLPVPIVLATTFVAALKFVPSVE